MPIPAAVEIGETFSRVHQFTPEAVSAFASTMGDTNPLHHDAALWIVTKVTPHRSRTGLVVDLAGAPREADGVDRVRATGQVLVGYE